MSQRRPPRRLIKVRLYRFVNQHQPAFVSLYFPLASNRLFFDYMAELAGELPLLPPVAAEPPANPEPPAEPLAEPAAQPAAANQVISSFWCVSFVLSFSYPFVRVSCFFLQRLGYLVFLQVSSTLFSIFNVPRVPRAYFWFSLRLLLLALFVHVFHFIRSFLFMVCLCSIRLREPIFCLERNRFVCMYGPGPFGSRSRFFVQDTLWRLLCWTARLWSRLCFGTNCFVYTVRDRSAPGAGFCLKTSIGVCGPGPFGSGSLFIV